MLVFTLYFLHTLVQVNHNVTFTRIPVRVLELKCAVPEDSSYNHLTNGHCTCSVTSKDEWRGVKTIIFFFFRVKCNEILLRVFGRVKISSGTYSTLPLSCSIILFCYFPLMFCTTQELLS